MTTSLPFTNSRRIASDVEENKILLIFSSSPRGGEEEEENDDEEKKKKVIIKFFLVGSPGHRPFDVQFFFFFRTPYF